ISGGGQRMAQPSRKQASATNGVVSVEKRSRSSAFPRLIGAPPPGGVGRPPQRPRSRNPPAPRQRRRERGREGGNATVRRPALRSSRAPPSRRRPPSTLICSCYLHCLDSPIVTETP